MDFFSILYADKLPAYVVGVATRNLLKWCTAVFVAGVFWPVLYNGIVWMGLCVRVVMNSVSSVMLEATSVGLGLARLFSEHNVELNDSAPESVPVTDIASSPYNDSVSDLSDSNDSDDSSDLSDLSDVGDSSDSSGNNLQVHPEQM